MEHNETELWKGILDKCGKCNSAIEVTRIVTIRREKVVIKCTNKECGQKKTLTGENTKVMTKWNKAQRKLKK